jgi:hypothetical protein
MLPTMSSKEESTARTVPGTSDPSDSSANDDLMRRHANRQECDLQVYDCDRQSSWTAPETVEINQQPVTGAGRQGPIWTVARPSVLRRMGEDRTIHHSLPVNLR